MADVFSLGWDDTLLRLAVAALLGAAIGLERELDEKALDCGRTCSSPPARSRALDAVAAADDVQEARWTA